MGKVVRFFLIVQLALLGACETVPTSPSTTATSDLFSFPPSDSAVIVVVRFKETASKTEMNSITTQATAALNQGSFADIPAIQARYEQYTTSFAWRSIEAGERGEIVLRDLLAQSTIVHQIEVMRR